MRALVTGHCGFIGQHVTRRLLAARDVVVGWDRAHPTTPRELMEIEARDLEGLDTIIHLAAHADVRHNWEIGRIDAVLNDNVYATIELLEAARYTKSIRRIVFVSTGAVYADCAGVVTERDVGRVTSPYAASKLSGEAYVQAYAARFGWQWTIARPAAAFGSGYKHGHVADFVEQTRHRNWIMALDDGFTPRPAVHVEDLADAIVHMASGGVPSGIYNVASHCEQWSWRDTVKLMGLPVVHRVSTNGWIGDGHGATMSTTSAWCMGIKCLRSIEDGVRDSLASLGYHRVTEAAE